MDPFPFTTASVDLYRFASAPTPRTVRRTLIGVIRGLSRVVIAATH